MTRNGKVDLFMILNEEYTNDLTIFQNKLKSFCSGKSRPVVYITDNYILNNYSSDQNYANNLKTLLVFIGVGDIELRSEADIKNLKFSIDLASFTSDMNALGRNVNFQHFASHDRFWIIEENALSIGTSLNGILAGEKTLIKILDKKETADVKNDYGIN